MVNNMCAQLPLIMSGTYASLFWIEISDTSDFVLSSPFPVVHSRHTGEFSCHGFVYVLLSPESMYPLCGSDDHGMSDASDLPCTCDSDVAGPGATSNDDSMHIDVDVSNPPMYM